jgi:nucleoside-diphosphate-sugar epimerase
MGKKKETVLLTGASGSMGKETFKLLWEKRDQYKLVLLLRPLEGDKLLFRPYEKEAGITPTEGSGTVEGEGLKIVWGDVLNREDVIEACRGIDCCLNAMALISPEADRNPEMARRVNHLGTKMIVEAIEAQDSDRIRMVYIGSVAEYGDRLPPFHVGRTGDPVLPSEFDYYALSKIGGELEVMQSSIRHRVSLRQTFIMIPGLFSLMDPIMYHQPINSFMENTTSRISGQLLVETLEVDDDSDFWGAYYNISGGPACRTTYYEFLHRIYTILGLRLERVMERSWFALRNFHMLFYEDAAKLNKYLHHWDSGDTMEDYYREVKKKLPWYLKITAWCCKYIPPYRWLIERVTRGQLKKLASQPDGTLRWVSDGDSDKINAFYGSDGKRRAIPGWGIDMPSLDHSLPHQRLDHGYDELKKTLELVDLKQAASFRGGELSEDEWNGDLHSKVNWRCCLDHSFEMTPHAVLKGGHWCPECLTPPWNYPEIAQKNRFVGQLFPAYL